MTVASPYSFETESDTNNVTSNETSDVMYTIHDSTDTIQCLPVVALVALFSNTVDRGV